MSSPVLDPITPRVLETHEKVLQSDIQAASLNYQRTQLQVRYDTSTTSDLIVDTTIITFVLWGLAHVDVV